MKLDLSLLFVETLAALVCPKSPLWVLQLAPNGTWCVKFAGWYFQFNALICVVEACLSCCKELCTWRWMCVWEVGCTFVDDSGMSVALHNAAICPGGIHCPASADRLRIQSFPNCEVWRVLPTTDARKCNSRLEGSGSPSVTHHNRVGGIPINQ